MFIGHDSEWEDKSLHLARDELLRVQWRVRTLL